MSSVSISLLNALRLKITGVGTEWDFFTCEIAFTVGNQDFFFFQYPEYEDRAL